MGSLGRNIDFFGYDRASGSVLRHGSLCCDTVLKLHVVTGSRQGFLCRDRVVFLLFSIAIGVHTGLRQCFVFYCDNAMTEVPLLQSGRS